MLLPNKTGRQGVQPRSRVVDVLPYDVLKCGVNLVVALPRGPEPFGADVRERLSKGVGGAFQTLGDPVLAVFFPGGLLLGFVSREEIDGGFFHRFGRIRPRLQFLKHRGEGGFVIFGVVRRFAPGGERGGQGRPAFAFHGVFAAAPKGGKFLFIPTGPIPQGVAPRGGRPIGFFRGESGFPFGRQGERRPLEGRRQSLGRLRVPEFFPGRAAIPFLAHAFLQRGPHRGGDVRVGPVVGGGKILRRQSERPFSGVLPTLGFFETFLDQGLTDFPALGQSGQLLIAFGGESDGRHRAPVGLQDPGKRGGGGESGFGETRNRRGTIINSVVLKPDLKSVVRPRQDPKGHQAALGGGVGGGQPDAFFGEKEFGPESEALRGINPLFEKRPGHDDRLSVQDRQLIVRVLKPLGVKDPAGQPHFDGEVALADPGRAQQRGGQEGIGPLTFLDPAGAQGELIFKRLELAAGFSHLAQPRQGEFRHRGQAITLQERREEIALIGNL